VLAGSGRWCEGIARNGQTTPPFADLDANWPSRVARARREGRQDGCEYQNPAVPHRPKPV